MSSPFVITAAVSSVLLDTSRQGQISFTVSNTTPRTVRGKARVVGLSANAGPRLTLLGEAEREFASNGSQQYSVQIVVPPNVPAGDYTIRLNIVDLANPDDDFSEGPTVKVVVPAPVVVKKPFPWWIVAVAVAALILLSGGIYAINKLNSKTVTPPPIIVQPTVAPAVGKWQSVAPLPSARGGLVTVVGTNGRFYAIGGYGATPFGSYFLSTVESYDPATNSWSPGALMPTRRAYMAAATGPDGLIYVIGGSNRSGDSGSSFLNTVETYNPQSNTWNSVAPLSIPRTNLAAVTGSDGLIYAIGGSTGETVNTVEVYDTRTQAWSQATSMPTARSGLAATSGSDGRIYVLGGQNGNTTLNTAEAYNPQTRSWATLAPMLSARTALSAVLGPDGRIYAIGGRNPGGTLKTVEAYDPKTNTWSLVSSMPTARNGLGTTLGKDGRIYAIGGFNNGGGYLNTVEAYTNPR